MKKRFVKAFNKLESRFNTDLDRIHSSLLSKFRMSFRQLEICGSRGGGGVFVAPKDASYIIVGWNGASGGGGGSSNNPLPVIPQPIPLRSQKGL